MSIIHDMEVQFRQHYRKNNWKQPSAIQMGRDALASYINEVNALRVMPPIPHDTEPERLYFKGVKLTLIDGLDGVEVVA